MLLYRKLEGEAGDRVTGFLSEMFGAVQALKVAGPRAEANAVRHFDRLNEERRRTAMQAKMLDTFAFSIHSFTVVLSTGAMLLMASRGIVAGSFTVGDFALFTYFLWFTSDFPSYLGTFVGDFKQQEVAIERLSELLPEEPAAAIVAPARVPLPGRRGLAAGAGSRGLATESAPITSCRGERPARAGSAGADLSAGGIGEWGARRQLQGPGRQLHRGDRADRVGQDDAAPGRARAAARSSRGGVLERPGRRRPGRVLPPAPQRVHPADAAPL